MGGELSVCVDSPARGCVSFLLELYVVLFNSCPPVYSFIHTNLLTIFSPVSSYAHSLINMSISAGLLYIHLHPDKMAALDWNPPFRAYTAAVWFFFVSNIFLVVAPFIPPAPGYQVFEGIPYYVSEPHNSGIRVECLGSLTTDYIASYSRTALWRWRLALWALHIGM